ncbi:HipA domain-containing protein [Pseudohaliea sp.]|uniref:type II toxin-antitoxin system HipA family toxin n=1 Tax=Pseudohaliea sp. TaxID=2740289 RepID=UPI0032EF9BB1
MEDEVEVHCDLQGECWRVGTLYRQPGRGRETVAFQYHAAWLEHPARFSLEPALALGRGTFHPAPGADVFGSIGDSAPDTWGRRLLQRRERRLARDEGRAPRTLQEIDYLLGVTDIARMGALRFKRPGDPDFQAPSIGGVPHLVQLGALMDSALRVDREDAADDALDTILAPGSSLGGARPKASVRSAKGELAIAKFPKDSDGYGQERWEHITLALAATSGIRTPRHELLDVDGRAVLLSYRFDRDGARRIPFLSAMAMLQARDGERGSYPEIVDELGRHGARARADAAELFRRMVFNILVSNVDDHLRNHGFLWAGAAGWILAPAYDLNPTPTDLKPRILSTNISLDEGTCSLPLALEQAALFGLSSRDARAIAAEVGRAVSGWRELAATQGVSASELERMASAFEHEDLAAARAL